MSNLVVALLFGIGVGAWIFAKVSHMTMSKQNGIIAAGVVGLILTLVMWSILGRVFPAAQ